MSQPYTGDPSTSTLSAFRFKICDTKEPFFFSDEELNFLLAEAGDDLLLACLAACRKKATHYAQCVDKSVGKVRISYSQLYTNARDLCDEIELQIRCSGAELFVGGLEPQKCGGPEEPVFELGQFDNDSLVAFDSDNEYSKFGDSH